MVLFGYRLPGMSSLILWGLLWEIIGQAATPVAGVSHPSTPQDRSLSAAAKPAGSSRDAR